MAEQKKKVRTKRSRLGRGLSALVEVPSGPVVVEAGEADTQPAAKSDNPIPKDKAAPVHIANTQGVISELAELKGGGGALKSVGSGLDESGAIEGSDGGLAGEAVGKGGLVEIAVGLIVANRDQPRRVFDEGALRELAASILEHGLMQPVVVRRIFGREDQQSGKAAKQQMKRGGEKNTGGTPVPRGSDAGHMGGVRYELIAGERRWRACQLAGLETVAAIVREVDDVTSAQFALIENIQREDLNSIEKAEGYRSLGDRYGMTQEQIAKSVGVSRSSLANTVRLLDLPDEVRYLIANRDLSPAHGKVLLSLGSPEKQRKFASRCLREGWNVRELDRACCDEADLGEEGSGGTPVQEAKSVGEERAVSVLRDLERQMGEELGTRVRIRTDKSRTRGRVVIEFYDLDQFDGLLGRFGVRNEG